MARSLETWPLRLAVQDVALSRRKHGFESRRGHQRYQYLIDDSVAGLRIFGNGSAISAEAPLTSAFDPFQTLAATLALAHSDISFTEAAWSR
jgi:hypothetical protein